jgi:hypothetical protein
MALLLSLRHISTVSHEAAGGSMVYRGLFAHQHYGRLLATAKAFSLGT